MSLQCTSGIPRCGRPPATGPMVAMPRPAKFQAALTAVAPMTANNEPGTLGGKAAKNKDEREDGGGDEQRGQMDLGQTAADFEELNERFA